MKTKDGIEIEHRLSGSHPPNFGGQQCGLREYFRLGSDWYHWERRSTFHKFWEYAASGFFTSQELLDFAGDQLEKK